MSRVTFLPGPLVAEAVPGERLLDVARRVGVGIASDCGGRGKCGSCLVQLEAAGLAQGALSEPTDDEARLLPPARDGLVYRLACAARVHGDVTVTIPPESRASRKPPRKPFTRQRIRIRPCVSRVAVELPAPSGGDDTLAGRIRTGLRLVTRGRASDASLAVLADFSRQEGSERSQRVTAALFQGREVIQLRPGANRRVYGVALDVGTTSIVAFLCDLVADRIVAVRSGANPQAAYGEDVISRIAAVQKDRGKLPELQGLVVREINALIAGAAEEASVSREDILDVVAVGNPTMQHLLLGLSPEGIGQAPYLPFCRRGGEVRAAELGLRVFPGARVHFLPMLSGFIGADTLAALLTRKKGFRRGNRLLVDVGTNGEVVLSSNGSLTATSCATGPVFEGAHIRSGMKGSPGAIEGVSIDAAGDIHLEIIEDETGEGQRPAGLCGSGVISAVAALARAGILTPDGAFDLERGHPSVRVDPQSGVAEFVLVRAAESRTGRDIVITQWDVRSVQLGKAALRAGIEILLRDQGVAALDRIYLAGTFGNYLDPEEILAIGMLPPVGADRIESIGNAAGDGARLALFSRLYRQKAIRLGERVEVVELSLRPDFQEVFVESMALTP